MFFFYAIREGDLLLVSTYAGSYCSRVEAHE